MLKNGTKSIIEEECLPVLINCTKLQPSEKNNNISKATAITTTQQRGTFQNLTNQHSDSPITASSTIIITTAISSITTTDFVLNHNQNDVSNVINDKNNNTVTVKSLYPRVIENSLEEKLPTLLSDKSSAVTSSSFDLKTKAKNKQKFASLRLGKKQLKLNSAENQVALNEIDTLTCDSIKAVTKSYQAKRRRANTFSKLDSESKSPAAHSKRIRIATIQQENTEEVLGTATALIEVVKNTRKRARIMSLYERRYQTDDARSSQPGVVSNGYLSSTRNSSAASSTVHSDENTDISNQYYIAASSATATASAASALANGSTSNYAPSMATLCNIGNTCYLNSVVYTLRFAPQFVHNLHHLIVDLSNIQQNIGKHRANKSSSLGRNISGAQMENARSWSSKDLASFDNYNVAVIAGSNSNSGATQLETQKSSQQLLTEKLHELYQNLHRNEIADSAEPFHADTLLHAIQEVSSIFEGNQQQDAHEFLMCVLNSIRETCQTLIKAIAECPDDILNGCISSNEQPDVQNAFSTDKDVVRSSQSSQTQSGGNTGSSSLSSNNITKASFFTRKSKRKEESKSSKNQRLQSPLKESAHTTAGSNSLFYLNTVDLSGANGKQQQQHQQQQATTNSNELSSGNSYNTTATTVVTTLQSISDPQAGGDDNIQDITTLKEKDRLAEKIRQLGLDFFRDDFEGITVSTTKCLSCETITEQKESMIDIAVPVPISGFDNADYMDKPNTFIQNSCITREYFRGENKYRCEQCIGYTEAIRSISYEVLPRLLVIQLSRFSGGMEKINSYIPTSFTLQCFCAKCCELNDSNKLHIYKLYSVITHVGATMSVGHYIAYTCSLDWANEYINCPKDMRRNQQFGSTTNGMQKNAATSTVSAGNVAASVGTNTSSSQSSAASAAASVLASSGTSLMKKMKFGRSKASSSGDMSKNVKNLNGVTSKAITNGIGKLSMNATCHSVRCCATRFKSNEAASSGTPISATQNSTGSSINGVGVGGLYISNNSDLSDENLQNGSSHHSNNSVSYNYSTSGYGSTGRSGGVGSSSKASQSSSSSSSNNAEPIWYMCDDDKIKAMTQREFEELLSPSRKITITPYLLFYARIDLQTIASQATPPKQAQTTTTTTTTQSWPANDASLLQRGQLDKM